ncbi:UDP-4-amino-4,6-dideoxy-N-acetyl-beta-L-altrosamine transaminase [Pontibacter sp. BT310]|uniref:UDP-4-amino-4, 6-dideoxy-N-acetyl-beta-L-altrosamine transaminase n=1 Tax=Pontibacter populi TaxID=890055 RepID=A0ABS6XF64_9BACT|nr:MULTISPECIES: UDP-4-amino-4,6-dideoxy-N-acetyl-beta-L-altrosamine transaminase [Pontibacter]MBJ6119683.1 UDP-4-amino-4,6-dideoxy-N-acetyl-beta-L-altrosamine transaminase [Pontibacter sp. BT310]MBR0572112.1 UDP-4-amino-4,6-dideoxy-N-acetyl-beta-L-altrosamine transaminase [Microvirga sp. STS03]MBW3366536.1 UDP-4-amino-4,6-dideoxy-N-acetyl-beta-L-altrosamine transaminase [Pontibacter populi]
MNSEPSTQNKPIPYGRQHITQDDIDAVIETLQSDFLTQGPKVAEFEQAFASYVGARYAVAVSNGTAALHLCAMALGVNEESRVITTPITFVASANCVRYCGGTVEFADINPATALLDINKVRALLESKPKGYYTGIIPVDFAGNTVNLEEFRKLADKYGLWLIEDACHAPGGYFTDSKGQKQLCGNGNYADLAIFSFHPVKHIATGEGGMITTNDEALYQKLLLYRTHGITRDPQLLEEDHGGWYMEMQELGYNYRIPDMLCALGVSQLKRADAGLARRRGIAKIYDAAFANAEGIEVLQTSPEALQGDSETGHAYHLYVIKVADRKGLYDFLRTHNIFAQVHYIPAHTMPYYRNLGYKKGDFPVAEAYYNECLSLPMYPSLTAEEQEFVIGKVKEFIG